MGDGYGKFFERAKKEGVKSYDTDDETQDDRVKKNVTSAWENLKAGVEAGVKTASDTLSAKKKKKD